MRLAACALSAVLLSGCSWLGMGGQSNGYGTSGGAYGVNCVPGQSASYGQYGQYGQGASYGYDAACAGGSYGVGQGYGGGYGAGQGFGGAYGAGLNGYGAGGAGFGQAGFGAGGAGFGPGGFGAGGAGFGPGGFGASGAGFGPGGAGFGPGGAGFGAGGAGFGPGGAGFGPAGFGAGGAGFGPGIVSPGLAAQGIGGGFGGNTVFSNGGVTTLGAGTQFGTAGFGGNVVGTQFANGQFVNGAAVQNVVGAPIYVPQPFAAPFGVPQLRGVGAALPFGFEVFGGTEFDIDGVAKPGKSRSPSDPGDGSVSPGIAGEFDNVDFNDAFSDGYTIGGAATYDLSRNTTLLASAAFSEKNGQTVDTGSFISGTYADPAHPTLAEFTPDIGAVDRDLEGSFSDFRQYTLEAGVRQYVGNGYGLRPYVGATGGFTYNNDVDVTQTYSDTGEVFAPKTEFIDSGWRPTAAGVIGAEMAVGPRAAIGVETGIRWRDGLKGDIVNNDDRFSIPLNLRGRVAF